MAKLTIEIEENEFALYEYVVWKDEDEPIAHSDGFHFTSESAALTEAESRITEYFAFRKFS